MAKKPAGKKPKPKPAKRTTAAEQLAQRKAAELAAAAAEREARRGKYRREKSNESSRRDSASIREIGELPAIADNRRRAKAIKSTKAFGETYFGERFTLKFSKDHDKAFERCDSAIDDGELFSWAMPRGSGKTSIAEVAAIRAICSGKHPFIALIGADKESAVDMLDSIKIEFEINELLAADFPEICFPIAALDGINHRCAGQLYRGERTRIEWGAERIVLPTIEGSPAAGAVIRCYGITGRIRGAKFRRPNGETIRPTFVVADDVQTDESAWSPSQCAHRERILKGAVLGLAGPGKRIAGIIPCTVIRRDDVADRLLDRRLNPEFHGERFSLLYAMPTALDLWERYNEHRIAGLESGAGLDDATRFYVANRKQLDAGAKVAWPERFDATAGELSALQHAMNLFFADPYSFACEYQNAPPKETGGDDVFLGAGAIACRINAFERRVVPNDATTITAFVDVQGSLLYYAVCAFAADFTGYVVDYGTWPEQSRQYFTLNNATRRFKDCVAATTVEGQIAAALRELIEGNLAVRDWRRPDGVGLRLSCCLVDAQWGDSTDVVYSFIQQAAFPNVWPSHGVFIGASGSPITDDRERKGQTIGHNWKIPADARKGVRRIVFDANYWKTFCHRRLATPVGDPGSVSLFHAPPAAHRMFADHLVAETPIATSGRGRQVVEWRHRPNKPDNHFFDCLAGCCCGASVVGVRLPGAALVTSRRRPRRNVNYL